MPTGDFKEDRLTASAQSTPCGTPSCTPNVTPAVTPSPSPYSSPKVNRRSWFSSLNPALSLPPSEASSISSSTTPPPPPTPSSSTSISSSSSSSGIVSEMGGNEGSGGGSGERWSLFGSSRPVVQKSSTDPGSESPGGFTLQSYFGVQKSTTLEEMKSQASLEHSASFHAPKIEITDLDGKKVLPRPHKLKHRDMNILTPSGF